MGDSFQVHVFGDPGMEMMLECDGCMCINHRKNCHFLMVSFFSSTDSLIWCHEGHSSCAASSPARSTCQKDQDAASGQRQRCSEPQCNKSPSLKCSMQMDFSLQGSPESRNSKTRFAPKDNEIILNSIRFSDF